MRAQGLPALSPKQGFHIEDDAPGKEEPRGILSSSYLPANTSEELVEDKYWE